MSQVLSQNEVDALLAAVSDGKLEADDGAEEGGAAAGGEKGPDVVHFDLTNQDRIIRGRMPTLDIIYDRFVRLFRVTLSNSLRKVANLSVSSTGPIKFGEFMNSLPLPSCLNIIKLEPLHGAAVIVVESRLLYALIDSYFGGSDVPYTKIEGKDFTAIEIRIARKIIMDVLDDLEKAWAPVYPLQFGYSRTEINPQFVAIVPPSDVVIQTTFDVELEKASGTMKLVMPYSSIEPIKSKLQAGFQSEQMEVDQVWVDRIKKQILGININMSCILGNTELSIGDFISLEPGDIVQLKDPANQPLKLFTQGVHKYDVLPGVMRGHKALKVIKMHKARPKSDF